MSQWYFWYWNWAILERLFPAICSFWLDGRSKHRSQAFASGSVSSNSMSTPIRRIRSDCCARVASGHTTVAHPARMKSRRLTGFLPVARSTYPSTSWIERWGARCRPADASSAFVAYITAVAMYSAVSLSSSTRGISIPLGASRSRCSFPISERDARSDYTNYTNR